MNELDQQSSNLLQHLLQATDEVMARLTKMSAPCSEAYAKTAYLAFLVRMSRIFESYVILLHHGYGTEAALLVRPFLETFVDWLYIETDPETIGERYVLYEAAARIQFLRDSGQKDKAARLVSEHGDHVLTFCRKYGKKRLPREWCDERIRHRASKGRFCGLDRVYPGLCDLLHNSPVTLPNYLSIDEDGTLWLRNEPNTAGHERTIGLICGALGVCLGKANDHFSLNCEQELEASSVRWQEYTQQIARENAAA